MKILSGVEDSLKTADIFQMYSCLLRVMKFCHFDRCLNIRGDCT